MSIKDLNLNLDLKMYNKAIRVTLVKYSKTALLIVFLLNYTVGVIRLFCHF